MTSEGEKAAQKSEEGGSGVEGKVQKGVVGDDR